MATAPKPEPIPTKKLIEFDAASHTYFADGEPVVSVTQVLKDAGMVDGRWFTDFHRWRGSATHEAIATWNRAGKIDRRTVDPKIRPYLEAAINWQDSVKFKPLYVEHRMYDPIFDVCGMADLIGYFEGESKLALVIVDFKTNDWKQGQLTSKWQLAAYGHAFGPKEIYRRIEVVLGPDGKAGPINSIPVQTYLEDVNTFHAFSITAKERRKAGFCE